MATGKRASMREGPLAALFRKTDEDADKADAPREERPQREEAPRRAGRARRVAGSRAPDA